MEFSASGTFLHYWQTSGHNDGLKIDPETGNVWALQNEDGNPNLVVISPTTTAAIAYTFATPDNGGTGTPGGYDDITFLNGRVYMTESNPDPTSTGSAVVQVRLPADPAVNNQVIIVRQVLPNNTTATNPSGQTVSLFLSDPDSMTASGNNLVFTSQADNEVLTIHNPGPHQFVTVVPVHDALSNSFEVDDTLFTPSGAGAILVVDSAGTVYEITGPAVTKGLVLSSADASNALGTFDPKTGLFTPIITGFAGQPKGLAFLPTGSLGISGELVKKDSMRKCIDHLIECKQELQAVRLSKENLAQELAAVHKDREEMRHEVQHLRERLASIEGRQSATPIIVPVVAPSAASNDPSMKTD